MTTEVSTQWYRMPKLLLRAKYVVCVNSEDVISITDTDKNIYVVLKTRYEYFTSVGKKYYDTQQQIADICGVTGKKVGATLRMLIDAGIIVAHKTDRGNWVYDNVYSPSLLCKEKKSLGKLSEDIWKPYDKHSVVQERMFIEGDDDFEFPF